LSVEREERGDEDIVLRPYLQSQSNRLAKYSNIVNRMGYCKSLDQCDYEKRRRKEL
jgi:hypothetical protein